MSFALGSRVSWQPGPCSPEPSEGGEGTVIGIDRNGAWVVALDLNTTGGWALIVNAVGFTSMLDLTPYLSRNCWLFNDVQLTPIVSKVKYTGMRCIGPCGTFAEYAEPNLPDGTFKCWSCRNRV